MHSVVHESHKGYYPESDFVLFEVRVTLFTLIILHLYLTDTLLTLLLKFYLFIEVYQ